MSFPDFHYGEQVTAHGRDWIVLSTIRLLDDRDIMAFAVPTDANFPALPQVIRYTPSYEIERRERKAECAAVGHVLRDKESMWNGKMRRSCECLENEQEREPTEEEKARW